MDKMLKRNKIDPRLLPESNIGDGKVHDKPDLTPQEKHIARKLFIEANA